MEASFFSQGFLGNLSEMFSEEGILIATRFSLLHLEHPTNDYNSEAQGNEGSWILSVFSFILNSPPFVLLITFHIKFISSLSIKQKNRQFKKQGFIGYLFLRISELIESQYC